MLVVFQALKYTELLVHVCEKCYDPAYVEEDNRSLSHTKIQEGEDWGRKSN